MFVWQLTATVRMIFIIQYSWAARHGVNTHAFHLIYSVWRRLAVIYLSLSIPFSRNPRFPSPHLYVSVSLTCSLCFFFTYGFLFEFSVCPLSLSLSRSSSSSSPHYRLCYTSLVNQIHASQSPTEPTPAAPPPIITHDEQPSSTNLSLKSQWTPSSPPISFCWMD